MDANQLEQLNTWHEKNKHQKIVDAILNLPEEERNYDLIGRLGRAYNNLGQYEEALEQFARTAEEGKTDPVWHYRVGYAYFYMSRYEEAAESFRISNELEPDEDTLELLNLSLSQAERERRQEQKAREARERVLRRQAEGGTAEPFAGFDLSDFWEDSTYARDQHVDEPLTDELLASVEAELGYKLPASYIALMKTQNGGIPKNTNFPTDEATSWSEDHIAITSISGIGRRKSYSLCGDMGSQFMIDEWGYPTIGVVICDCPSAGHDLVMLDYRLCGKDGEPQVVHVDQEGGYEITFLAEDFETFIRGLVNDEQYDTSAEDKEEDLRKVAEGQFSPLLSELCAQDTGIDRLEHKIRSVCTQIVEEKGHFSFHADELSYLMYDLQFWLYTRLYPDTNREKYLAVYQDIIAFGKDFGQGGHAPAWITDWLDKRKREGRIIHGPRGLQMTEEASAEMIARLNEAAEGRSV